MKKLLVLLCLVLASVMPSQGLKAQQWVVELDNSRYKSFCQNIAVDSGSAMLSVGSSRLYPEGYTDAMGHLLKVDGDGTTHSREIRLEGEQLFLFTVTELDNGNYMVFGVYDDSLKKPNQDNYRYMKVIVLDKTLETVLEKDYQVDVDGSVGFRAIAHHTMRCVRAEDGNVILATCPCYYIPAQTGGHYLRRFRFYEFSPDGDTVHSTLQPEYVDDMPQAGSNIENIFPNPATGGFTFVAKGNHAYTPNYIMEGCYGVWNIDRNLTITSHRPVAFGDYPYYFGPDHMAVEGRWYDNGRFLTVIDKMKSMGENELSGWLYMMDGQAEMGPYTQLPPTDSVTLSSASGCCTAHVDDSSIFVTSYSTREYISFDDWQGNITLVDKDLNILGRKVLKEEGLDYVPQAPVALSGGKVIIPVRKDGPQNVMHYSIYCLTRDDIEITWDVVRERPSVLRAEAYPNPATEKLNIPVWDIIPGKMRLVIADMKGAAYVDAPVEVSGNLISVDVRNLAPGVYVYQVVNNDKVESSGKFVKE